MEGGGRKPTAPASSGYGYGYSSSSSASTGSSISNDLFGPKGSLPAKPNSSTGIFDSVSSHPSAYPRNEVIGSWRKKDSENQGWNPKHETTPGNGPQGNEGYGQGGYNRGRNSIFQDEKVEPHYLSSSIHYGGQDHYSSPSAARPSASPHTYKKDGEEDDANGSNLHSASRGNWWQGGLYY